MPSSTHAAVINAVGQPWSIETIALDDPHAGDVLVKTAYAGLCHSDEHVVTGDVPLPLPAIGGHEGSGEVIAVGAGVRSVAVGDHVAMSFIPSCGHCGPCGRGRQYLCDDGAKLFDVGMMSDVREAHHLDGTGIARYAQLGTFAEYVLVHENSLVRVDDDLPLDVVALVSCGVSTGFGSATDRAGTQPGDTVAVIGVGGIGMNAVQGARIAGAERVIAIDPVAFKREQAPAFGATDTFSSIDEALLAVADLTRGAMCDRVVLCPSVVHGDMIESALSLTAKGGTLVVTGIAPLLENDVQLNLFMLSMLNKEVKGTVFGSTNPRAQIPKMLSLYRAGTLRLDELITKRYRLDQINEGYADLREGTILRGVVDFT